MLVRTKRRHDNAYGDKYEKFPGKVYELPEAEARTLIDDGLVEEHGASGDDGGDGGAGDDDEDAGAD